ncbi:MAG: 50S ribosomal protein L9 [Candidatus Margulisbacteria bacterium]|nr:50S ribosomal protein L9 [Candidatus Margulisiibacteriota bacterium]
MKVILLEDDVKLGDKGTVVTVKKGFAKNYLLPNKKALVASESNLSVMKNALAQQNRKIEKERKEHQTQAEQIKKISCEFTAKAGITGHIFGSITTEQIVEQIKEKTGLEISKKKVALNTHIKTAGQYSAKIKLYTGVDVVIPVIVKVEKIEEDEEEVAKPVRAKAAKAKAIEEDADIEVEAAEAEAEEAPQEAKKPRTKRKKSEEKSEEKAEEKTEEQSDN